MSDLPSVTRGLDALDRRIVAALQRDGRASWTTLAEQCGTSGPTAARRVQHLIENGMVRVAVMPGLSVEETREFFFIRLGCRQGAALEAAAHLAARDDVRFVTLVTGPYDVIAEVESPREVGSYHRLVRELRSIDGIERVSSDLILHVYKVGHDWARGLIEPEEPVGVTHPVPRGDPSTMDEVDHAILRHLHEDGRASFAEVSEVLAVNESTVRRRFERMLTSGLAQIVTLVPAAALGFESEVQLQIDVDPAHLTAVAETLGRHRKVRYLALTLGSNALVCEVIATSTKDLYEFMTSQLTALDGILGWSASVELLTIKRGFVETPWWRREAPALSGLDAAAPADADLHSTRPGT